MVRSVVPVFAFIGGVTAALVWWHHLAHSTLNATQASIALFCAVNIFVALSECVGPAKINRSANLLLSPSRLSSRRQVHAAVSHS